MHQQQFGWTFQDALTLARNGRNQAVIYYQLDGVRAVYEVTHVSPHSVGTIVINGRHLTAGDLPSDLRRVVEDCRDPDEMVNVRMLVTGAEMILKHCGLSIKHGWSLRLPVPS